MRGNYFAIIVNFECPIDTRSNKKAKKQRPFCGKQIARSKSKKEIKNLECILEKNATYLTKRETLFLIKPKLAVEKQFTVANKLLWRLWS